MRSFRFGAPSPPVPMAIWILLPPALGLYVFGKNFRSKVPAWRPASLLSIPMNALRLLPSTSESHVSTGIPAASYLAMTGTRGATSFAEIAAQDSFPAESRFSRNCTCLATSDSVVPLNSHLALNCLAPAWHPSRASRKNGLSTDFGLRSTVSSWAPALAVQNAPARARAATADTLILRMSGPPCSARITGGEGAGGAAGPGPARRLRSGAPPPPPESSTRTLGPAPARCGSDPRGQPQ